MAEESKHSFRPDVTKTQNLVSPGHERRSPASQVQSYYAKMGQDKFERDAKL